MIITWLNLFVCLCRWPCNVNTTAACIEYIIEFCRFWGMLGYLANTLIFILVGVVIAQQAFSDVETIDWIYVIALYIGIMVIR